MYKHNRNVLVACVCVRRRSNIKNEFIVSLMSDEKGHLTEVTVQREKHTKYFYIQNPLTLKRSHQYDSLPNRLTNPLPIFGQRVHWSLCYLPCPWFAALWQTKMLPSLCTKSGGKVYGTSNISDRWHLKTDTTPFGEKRYRNLKLDNKISSQTRKWSTRRVLYRRRERNKHQTLAMNKVLLSTDVSKYTIVCHLLLLIQVFSSSLKILFIPDSVHFFGSQKRRTRFD